MLKNYLKIAWRNLLRNKVYFFINILGLSIALTVAFLMLLWVYDEYNTDKFHTNNDQLYRIKRTIPLEEGVLDVYPGLSYPLLKTANSLKIKGGVPRMREGGIENMKKRTSINSKKSC